MKTDRSNTWLQKKGAGQIDLYVNTANVILPERETMIEILVDLIGSHFGTRTGLNILDLGCGDGLITACIQARYPDNTFHLLDGSPVMLDKARQRLGDRGTVFIQQTFEAYIDADVDDARYDLIDQLERSVLVRFVVHDAREYDTTRLSPRTATRPVIEIDAVRENNGPVVRPQNRISIPRGNERNVGRLANKTLLDPSGLCVP